MCAQFWLQLPLKAVKSVFQNKRKLQWAILQQTKKMIIDFRSDTVTKPTPAMLEAMTKAKVGDDVFGEDPSINELENMAAEMFGMEAGLFCPSGTMTNQIAIKCHTQPLDEVVCDHFSHIYQYEVGGYAYNSGVAINLIAGVNGKITASQVAAAIKPEHDWLPRTRLVVLENTANKGGGSVYTLDEVRPIRQLCLLAFENGIHMRKEVGSNTVRHSGCWRHNFPQSHGTLFAPGEASTIVW